MIGSSNYEINFPHKILLTNTLVSKICKVFATGSSANIEFSKTQSTKFVQSGGFVDVLDLFINPHENPTLNPDKTIKKLLINQINYYKNWQLMI